MPYKDVSDRQNWSLTYFQNYRFEKQSLGLCIYWNCNNKHLLNHGLCEIHQKESKLSKKKLRDERRRLGLCGCGRQSADGYIKCDRCLETERKRKLRPLNRYKLGIQYAKKKGKEWTITLDEFTSLIAMPCHYCGLSTGETVGTSLDRINNSKGYHTNNVLPCCNDCNCARHDAFTVSEMLLIGKTIRQIKLTRGNNGNTTIS